MTTVVYAIAGGGRIKIGYSNNAQSRLGDIQVGTADKLELLGTVPGGRETEAAIHKRLGHRFYIRGEWFHDTDEARRILREFGFDIVVSPPAPPPPPPRPAPDTWEGMTNRFGDLIALVPTLAPQGSQPFKEMVRELDTAHRAFCALCDGAFRSGVNESYDVVKSALGIIARLENDLTRLSGKPITEAVS